MKLIFQSLKKYGRYVFLAIIIKLFATLSELSLPYILEHIIDDVVPSKDIKTVVLWGLLMFVAALLCRFLNVTANRRAVNNAHHISYDIRQRLFEKTVNLTGKQFDSFGLPSIISRMTSDSYNVQSSVQQFQTLCVRAPMMLIGGVIVSMIMDAKLALIMVVMLPVLIAIIFFVSSKGIPLFTAVQSKLDNVVRVMRENITGIRVVKALSKEKYEKNRFSSVNEELTKQDIKATTVMAIPGPMMQLSINIGLSLVVLIGALRVNEGLAKPGVILAFLTYFNMVAMGVMGMNRIFITMSKASASADRINKVLLTDTEEHLKNTDDVINDGSYIKFSHVSFSYNESIENSSGFYEGEHEKSLDDIDFELKKGESLGIIGPTGSGKTTIINLLMKFYEPDSGKIYINGKNVLSYRKDELRNMVGAVFQNDMIFNDTIRENIAFGRQFDDKRIWEAAEDSMAADFIKIIPQQLDYVAGIKGADLSGGQKQRLLIARALVGRPDILVFDDSSSALDYKTDSNMRKAIKEHYPDATMIMIAQRISSIMGMDKIMVLDNGHCIGFGKHEDLIDTCKIYKETFEAQMGSFEE